jgi:hypothetical protein
MPDKPKKDIFVEEAMVLFLLRDCEENIKIDKIDML